MQAQPVTLDDKYELESGRIFVSGVQALVRLPMMQRARDKAAGLNTAAFISGYRGSPLGGYGRICTRIADEKAQAYEQPSCGEKCSCAR